MRTRVFLRELAPDFMWCTVFDLFLMYEQINEAIEFHVFKQSFHQLFSRGEFFCKDDESAARKGAPRRRLYLRNNPPPGSSGGPPRRD